MIGYYVSASGYPVFHFHKPDSAITEVQILSKCGSAHEDNDSWGVAHFLEHLCIQGTPTKNKHQISREMALIGHYNAYTSYFNTVYHFDCLNESFEAGFALLKESVFDSNFPEHEFEKEKNVIVEEWRMYDNYPTESYRNFSLEKYFGAKEGHPIIGTEESILGMNPEKLHRFRNKWYGKSNIAIIVVGGVNFLEVEHVVDKYLPPALEVETTPDCLQVSVYDDKVQSFETSRFEQAIFGLMQPWVNSEEIIEKNYVPSFMLRALATYLHEYIRDDLGLCYGIKQGKMSNYGNTYLSTYILTSKDNLEKAEVELFKSYDKVKNEGFPEDIFNIAKVQATYGQLKTLQDVSGIGSSITSLLMSSRDLNWVLGKGSWYLEEWWLKEQAAKLTPKDIQDSAIQLLGEDVVKFTMIPVPKNN